ncbi:MAG TPA: MarR family transcriptional regulator [Candidatus Limiplasma sp.]|nr:MarR family transcriptional regulator [Candidatus Limiplasma sp.]HPS80685.1 MarR family transcriptional regulator [Candidatus Limiplasma sp.]
MPRKHVANDGLIDSVAQNLFLALPIFRKRLLHMDVIQREFNVPLSHVQVMAMLNDNGSMNVSEISRRLGIAKPNITPLIDRLIEEHYVERKRDENDRRMVNVSICPLGVSRLMEIRQKMRELVGEWATTLSSAELRELNESLRNINQVLGSSLQNNRE